MHFFEMKNWRADVHLAAIQHDVAALRDRLGEHRHGYILVTAMNPLGMTDENLQYLLAHVPDLINVPRELFRFPTKDVDNEDYEFWVCGWPVLPAGQAPAPEQAG